MRSRNVGARLAVLAGSFVVLAGFGSTVGAASAAARMKSGASSAPNPSFTCGCESFTIEKLQQIAGTKTGFTKLRLTGAVGQTVDYEIVVTDTGTTPITLSEFTDPHCDAGTITGGSNALLAQESTTYTCSHVLNAMGIYTNQASVSASALIGPPVTETSNEVVVEVPTPPPPPPAPSFTIEKRQETAGSGGGFTTSPLTGAVGQTVDYQIVVDNTGNEALTLASPIDEHCDNGTLAGGPAEALLVPGASTTYTCSRALTSEGQYVNEATVTGTPVGGAPITHTSNQVVVVVPPVVPHGSSFTIEKLQQLAGIGSFTTGKLGGSLVRKGATVNYEIVIKNTGGEALTFSNFSDPHCDAGTIVGSAGAVVVPPASSTTYTCRHVMGEEKTYVNVASVTGAAQGVAPLTKSSNQVEVEGGVLCAIESHPLLRGASGTKRAPFIARVSAGSGVKQVTFYLDGHKVKTVKRARAKSGGFMVRIDPRRLTVGKHRVTAKISLLEEPSGECRPKALAATFVDPPRKLPHFTA